MTTAAPEPDVLDVDASPSRGLRVLVALTVLVLLLGAFAFAWGEGQRREADERRALDACAELAVDAVERAEGRLARMINYVRPVLGSTTAEVEVGLRRLVSNQATDGRPPVEAALRTCRGVDVWPLNNDHRDERAALVAYLEAERQRLLVLERDARDFSSGYDEMRALRP